MGINIRTNVPSLSAQRNLGLSTDRLNLAYRRLSSGLRIASASDDAAGLAVADQLRADARIAQVAIRNANDGISIINISDSAMDQIGNTLARMTELAEQSANGVYSNDQRSALQQEFRFLGSEIERIAVTTEFNGVKLISDGAQVIFQVGFDGQSTSQVAFSGVQATLAGLGLAGTGSSVLSFSLIGNTLAESQDASRSALEGVKDAIGSVARNRGILGAAESRLNITINNLQVARENFQAAESRIRDVDVASEAAELTRLNILQQAATSVLAQANQQPQLALNLLQ
ncbi:MAG: flagellin [bacterium]|nr:flagellin [bacterium]